MNHNPDCLLCQQQQATGHPRAHRYCWTAVMDTALTVAYRSGFGAVKRLWKTDARFADRPYSVVKYRGFKVGLIKEHSRQFWSPDEVQIFTDHVGCQYALTTWQRMLKKRGFTRTPGQIKHYLWRMEGTSRQGEWSLYDVAQGFGVSHGLVERWVRDGSLQATTMAGEVKPRRYVTTKALRRMLTASPLLLAGCKVDAPWLISLLVDNGIGRTHEAPDQDDESGAWMTGAPARRVG